MSQEDLVDDAAEAILAQASVAGQRCRLPKEVAALKVLEQAYARAIADAINFRGADDPDRIRVAIATLRKNLEDDVLLQVVVRKGLRHGR